MSCLRLARRACPGLVIALLLNQTPVALAHSGQPVVPRDLWSAWNSDFFLLLTLEVSAFVYVWGVWSAWRHGGVGRGIPLRCCLSFMGGFLALVVALVSPLDALSVTLFSTHMSQHLMLNLIVAPLFVLSDFPMALMWALPRRLAVALARRWNRASLLQHLWRAIEHPLSAWLLFAVTMWTWHAPTLYQLALNDQTIHAVEHLGFLLTAMLFWKVVFEVSRPGNTRYGIAVPYLFSTAIHSSILGALLTFATQPWYSYYAATVAPWGLTPLQDQQLAGLIMWIPAGTVFTFLSLVYFKAWLTSLDQRVTQMQSR